jgi:hypothetical protein
MPLLGAVEQRCDQDKHTLCTSPGLQEFWAMTEDKARKRAIRERMALPNYALVERVPRVCRMVRASKSSPAARWLSPSAIQ